MIKICFPPGCYGHYIGTCIYNFTNLRSEPFQDFEFDQAGSSHALRTNSELKQHVRVGHFAYATAGTQHDATIQILPTGLAVTVLPTAGHWLDYYNNQFVKQSKNNLVQAISEQLSLDELQHKLATQWQYPGNFDTTVPVWILRELFSFLIWDMLHDGYAKDWRCIKPSVCLAAQDLFEDYATVFKTLCSQLRLQITVTDECMQKNHQRFVQAQSYHNSQQRCEQWVQDVIASVDSKVCPAQTLFDEAYIQHYLRISGYEIQCDGLNQLPVLSQHMTTLIFKI
jgi:hypothetical protein